MSLSGLDKVSHRTEAEVRAARTMRERAADACDRLGDETYARILKRGGGIAALAQRHYINCAMAIRNIPLDGDAPTDSAGSAIADLVSKLREGLADMRRRRVIDESDDGEWLDAMDAEAARVLALVGHTMPGRK